MQIIFVESSLDIKISIYNEIMTRINVIPVYELADQHLMAEYRELPRVLKQKINIDGASSTYILGKGHVKWAAAHLGFIYNRYYELIQEMKYRGFNTSFDSIEKPTSDNTYNVTDADIKTNRERILDRIRSKPTWYRWTKRNKPSWVITD